MRCRTHNLEYGYTCPACDEEYVYVGRTYLLPAFNAGVKGEDFKSDDVEQMAAYKHGQRFSSKKNNGSESKNSRYSKSKSKPPKGESMAKKTAPAATLNFASMIGATVVPGSDSKKKKGETLPVIKLDEANSGYLAKFLDSKKKYKEAEADMRTNESPVLEICINQMDDDGLKGNFNHSYEVISADSKTRAKFITVDKHSVSQEQQNLLVIKGVLDEEFDKEIVGKPTITMRDEVYTDEKLQKELVAKLGDDFGKFFKTEIRYSVKEGFNERKYKLAKGDRNKLMQIKSLIPQSKPFFK